MTQSLKPSFLNRHVWHSVCWLQLFVDYGCVQMVGRTGQLAEAGSYFTGSVAGMPYIVCK